MPLEDYAKFPEPFESDGMHHPVFHRGTGPGIIILHELFGMSKECVALGDCVAGDGFTVFLPLLFGQPEKGSGLNAARPCIGREFKCMAARESSPIATWLRALSREVHRRCGGRGVGAIGMCLTGGFVLSMMIDDAMMAPVTCQPSLPLSGALPFGLGGSKKAELGISDEDLAAAKRRHEAGVPLLGLRYERDTICPRERFDRLQKEFPGFIRVDIPSSDKKHSTLTYDFDAAAYVTVVGFLRRQLLGAP